MNYGRNQLLIILCVGVLCGLLGFAISIWVLTPKFTAADLQIAEADRLQSLQNTDLAEDIASLRGQCHNGAIKASAMGYAALCKDSHWSVPGYTELNDQLTKLALSEHHSNQSAP
jgi:hypothetical protein